MITRLVVFAALAFAFPDTSTPARAAEVDGPFRQLTFAAACEQAASEGKLVFVDVWAPWCGPCKLLNKHTWTDASVAELLTAHTVAIKINVDDNAAIAAKYKIESIPTLLVLRPDGTEVTRSVGYIDAVQFKAALGSTLKTGS